tara:strand:- start:37 stop:1338 length:1302 start_codon:yes stop_codon:yes gene_type:complete
MSNLPPELQHINPNGPWLPHEADWEGNKKDVFEDDDRLKIFVQPANTGGCAFYRCWQPFKKLGEKHSDEVQIIYDMNPLRIDAKVGTYGERSENMDKCDIFFTHNICNFGGVYTAQCIYQARQAGAIVHYDTDDLLTELYDGHRLQSLYKEKQLDEITKDMYKMAHITSVTQRKFAERIQEFVGGYLLVIKNAIDFTAPHWNYPKIHVKKKNFVRVGWVGGIHHEEDVKEFANVALRVNARIGAENVHWHFFGRPPLEPGKKASEDWQQSVWDNYTKILAGGIKNYSIHGALPTATYGQMYSIIDISIAPLQMNAFNDSKSEIKAIESGIYSAPLIAQDVGCYDEVIKNGETGYLIPNGPDSAKIWVKTLIKVIKDRKLRLRMGKNLRKAVEDTYDINNHVSGRLEVYTGILEERDRQVVEKELREKESSTKE